VNLFGGIDLGSSFAKCVIIDESGQMVSNSVSRSGIDFASTAKKIFDDSLAQIQKDADDVRAVVATGVGRNNCDFKVFSKPEIGAFARGSYHLFGGPCVVIDIGGQDNKVIKLDSEGKQTFFKMNRKCASGTGSFLEEIAMRLDLPTSKMNEMARQTHESVTIGSFCTVFAGTEIIHHLRAGQNTHGIMRGVYESVVKRVLEMATIEDTVILTGGAIANNPVLVELFQERISHSIKVPDRPQLIGALGAALYAKEYWENPTAAESP